MSDRLAPFVYKRSSPPLVPLSDELAQHIIKLHRERHRVILTVGVCPCGLGRIYVCLTCREPLLMGSEGSPCEHVLRLPDTRGWWWPTESGWRTA